MRAAILTAGARALIAHDDEPPATNPGVFEEIKRLVHFWMSYAEWKTSVSIGSSTEALVAGRWSASDGDRVDEKLIV